MVRLTGLQYKHSSPGPNVSMLHRESYRMREAGTRAISGSRFVQDRVREVWASRAAYGIEAMNRHLFATMQVQMFQAFPVRRTHHTS